MKNIKNTGVKRKRATKKNVNKKKVNVNKVKRQINKYSDKVKDFILGISKGSSKTILANLPQTIIYMLIWLLLFVASWGLSVLFWTPNIKFDSSSPLGIDMIGLLDDMSSIVMFLLITSLELLKANDSLISLRLRENYSTYSKTKRMLRIYLIMSVMASISYLSIDKEKYTDISPITAMVKTFLDLVINFDLERFLIIVLSCIVSIVVEISIQEIPKKIQVIWIGDSVKLNNKKSISLKGKIKKYMRKGKEFISNRGKDKNVVNSDNYKNRNINTSEKVDKSNSLDINNSYNQENKDIEDDKKVIDLNKKVKINDKEDLKKKYKSNVDISIVNKAIEYLEKIKGDKDKIKIKVEDLKINVGIDHNKWQPLRNKLLLEGYIEQTGKRTFYYIGKKKRKYNTN